ncbi:MAG: ATP-dependent helicase [Thioploca sp.]|nr:ATP-dependent helicase [Thioploca sp.]
MYSVANYKKRTRAPAPIRKKLVWSSYQHDIFSEIETGDGHLIVLAVPGSGKTSTIVEANYHVPQELVSAGEVLNCAFNKDIVDALDKQLPRNIGRSTFHKLGFRNVQKYWGPIYGINGYSVDKDDVVANQLAEEVSGSNDSEELRKSLIVAMKLAKAKLASTVEEIDIICLEHGIKTRGINRAGFVEMVKEMMEKTLDEPGMINGKSVISFDDMLWLPYMKGWPAARQYEYIFIDEAQDLSAVRTELVLSYLAPNGRLAAFGDRNQAIYSWAGSTNKSLINLQLTCKQKKCH